MLQLNNPSNRILLVMRNRLPNCDWFGLPVVYSEDNARSWQFISQLDQTTHPTGRFDRGLWEPFLYNLPNGCVGGFYASELYADSGYNQIVAQRVSCNGGATWGNIISAAAQHDGVSRPGMPGVARLANGQTILVFEVCGTDDCNVHFKISNDGMSWPAGLGSRIANQRAGPYVTVAENGRIIVTSACTNQISISDNNGQTWYENSSPAWNANCYTWPAVNYMGSKLVAVSVSENYPLRSKFVLETSQIKNNYVCSLKSEKL